MPASSPRRRRCSTPAATRSIATSAASGASRTPPTSSRSSSRTSPRTRPFCRGFDGLSDMVTSLEINRLVRLHAGDPAAAVKALIAAANDAGGKDNITVILAEGREFAHHTPPRRSCSRRCSSRDIRRRRGDPGTHYRAAPPPASNCSGFRNQLQSAHRPGRKQGPFARLFGSRGLALVVGALLGVSAALLPGYLERPSGGRRLVVGGPTGEFASISAALARAEAGDVVLVEPGERRASRSAGRRRARLARARCGGARRRAEPGPVGVDDREGRTGRSSRIPHPGPCEGTIYIACACRATASRSTTRRSRAPSKQPSRSRPGRRQRLARQPVHRLRRSRAAGRGDLANAAPESVRRDLGIRARSASTSEPARRRDSTTTCSA